MMVIFQIPNPKSQTIYKSQFPKFKLTVCNLWFVICGLFVICNLVLVIFSGNSFAQPLSSAELINNAKLYDGKIVIYEGEVIGDIMARGEYAWLNVNDAQNAIGIWIDKGLTKEILYAGSYEFKGDVLEVTGVFNRACVQHGGDLDIHAQSIRKISQGKELKERLNLSKRNTAFFLLGVLLVVLILRRFTNL